MLDSFGYVAEGSGENLFMVRDGALYTSPIASSILNGITRKSVIRLAGELGIDVKVENLPRESLYTSDELFFCGTAVEITPVRSVDRVSIGTGKPGPVTNAIKDQFLGIATGKLADRHGWLTFVPEAAAVA
jgi:branched-chain amino acid aminotransferase